MWFSTIVLFIIHKISRISACFLSFFSFVYVHRYTWPCMCMWRPETDVKCHPLSLSTLLLRQCPLVDLIDLDGIPGQQLLEFIFFHSLFCTLICLEFKCLLKIQTQVFLLRQQAIYPLSNFPRSCIFNRWYYFMVWLTKNEKRKKAQVIKQ